MSRKAETRDARDRPITRRMRRAMEAEEARDKAQKRRFRVLDALKAGGARLRAGDEVELDEESAKGLLAARIIEAIAARKARATDKE